MQMVLDSACNSRNIRSDRNIRSAQSIGIVL
jgi:hypothetical protein